MSTHFSVEYKNMDRCATEYKEESTQLASVMDEIERLCNTLHETGSSYDEVVDTMKVIMKKMDDIQVGLASLGTTLEEIVLEYKGSEDKASDLVALLARIAGLIAAIVANIFGKDDSSESGSGSGGSGSGSGGSGSGSGGSGSSSGGSGSSSGGSGSGSGGSGSGSGSGSDDIGNGSEETPPARIPGGEEIKRNDYDMTLDQMVEKQRASSTYNHGDGRGWVQASDDEIRYYLDPNNFKDDPVKKYMFLDLSASAGLSEEQIGKYLDGKGILDDKEACYLEASRKYGVSEAYLVAHSSLETGNGTSSLATGVDYYDPNTGKTYKVYNMYGLGANDGNAVQDGAKYAFEHGWFTPEDAIMGGAEDISKRYINRQPNQQNTLYEMRWNPDHPTEHHYATDVRWAESQASTIKAMYDEFPDAQLTFEYPNYK